MLWLGNLLDRLGDVTFCTQFQAVDHVLEDFGGVWLAVVAHAELWEEPGLDDQAVQQLQGQGFLPGWLVRVEKLHDKRQKYLALVTSSL